MFKTNVVKVFDKTKANQNMKSSIFRSSFGYGFSKADLDLLKIYKCHLFERF